MSTWHFGGTATGGFSMPGSMFHSFGFEDTRMTELRRRVLERVNSDTRLVRYVLDKYGAPNGEPFFQEMCQQERELQAQIAQRLAERERAGRFSPKPGQTFVEQGPPQKPPPVPLVIEEVPELEFLPWLRAAASKSRESR